MLLLTLPYPNFFTQEHQIISPKEEENHSRFSNPHSALFHSHICTFANYLPPAKIYSFNSELNCFCFTKCSKVK